MPLDPKVKALVTKALTAKPVKQPKYQPALDYILPYMNQAVKHAENNPNNFGVLSEQVNSPTKANRVLNNSIKNNFWRWLGTSQNNQLPPIPFVDFMQRRWAPIGAPNDPRNLNRNWAPNVRDGLQKQMPPQEYERLRKLHLVQQPPWLNGGNEINQQQQGGFV